MTTKPLNLADRIHPAADGEPAIMCTGCGTKTFNTIGWWYGDHADNYSGTVWHCPECARLCQQETRDDEEDDD
jgi:hypothetical protein